MCLPHERYRDESIPKSATSANTPTKALRSFILFALMVISSSMIIVASNSSSIGWRRDASASRAVG